MVEISSSLILFWLDLFLASAASHWWELENSQLSIDTLKVLSKPCAQLRQKYQEMKDLKNGKKGASYIYIHKVNDVTGHNL